MWHSFLPEIQEEIKLYLRVMLFLISVYIQNKEERYYHIKTAADCGILVKAENIEAIIIT